MLDIAKHKFILVQILKDIYLDKDIGPILGFKGGTAVYLFYNLPRFSVDLDFNLLDETKIALVFRKIKSILIKYGKLKEAKEKRFTLFFIISYGEKDTNIKLEISKRKYPDKYEIKNYLGISMLVMGKDDMAAHKLVALLERKSIANRDLFDIWYFFKNNWSVNKDLVEIRTGQKFEKILKKCIKIVEQIKEKTILQGLGEILEERQKDRVKAKLKQELLFLLNYYLNNISVLGK